MIRALPILLLALPAAAQIDWGAVASVTLPAGEVQSVSIDGAPVWTRPNPLPYDSQIEYLESDGTAWIDTGIVPQLDDDVEITLAKRSGGHYYGCTGSNWRVNAFALYSWQFWLGNSSTSSTIDPNGPATFRISGRSLYKDGVLFASFPDATGDPIRSAYLFALHDYKASPTYVYKGAISRYVHSRGGVTLLDLVAVRVGSVGTMYDRVSGTLCAVSGTGSFILGPDKP